MEGVLAAFAQFDDDVSSNRFRAVMRSTLRQLPPADLVDAPTVVWLPQVPDGKGVAGT